jgi:hypothetical protein
MVPIGRPPFMLPIGRAPFMVPISSLLSIIAPLTPKNIPITTPANNSKNSPFFHPENTKLPLSPLPRDLKFFLPHDRFIFPSNF